MSEHNEWVFLDSGPDGVNGEVVKRSDLPDHAFPGAGYITTEIDGVTHQLEVWVVED